jgi:hypothetical protein
MILLPKLWTRGYSYTSTSTCKSRGCLGMSSGMDVLVSSSFHLTSLCASSFRFTTAALSPRTQQATQAQHVCIQRERERERERERDAHTQTYVYACVCVCVCVCVSLSLSLSLSLYNKHIYTYRPHATSVRKTLASPHCFKASYVRSLRPHTLVAEGLTDYSLKA